MKETMQDLQPAYTYALSLCQVIEDVDKERKHTIDAAIVRIMKARKVGLQCVLPGLWRLSFL